MKRLAMNSGSLLAVALLLAGEASSSRSLFGADAPVKAGAGKKSEPGKKPAVLELDEALTPFVPKVARTAPEEDKLTARALFAAGRLHEQRQELPLALKKYQQALRYDPDSVTVLRQIYPLAFSLDRGEEGVRHALKLVHLDPTDQMLIRRLGAFLTDRKDFGGALKLYERVLDTDNSMSKTSPAYVTLMAQMGDLYFTLENYEKASTCYEVVEKALEDSRKFGLNDRMRTLLLGKADKTFAQFGTAYLRAKKPKQAIAAFQKADEASPNKGLAAWYKAQVEAESGAPDKALAELEVYFQHQVKNAGKPQFELLAKVLKDLKKDGELIERLEKLHKDDPDNTALALHLAKQYQTAKQLDKAETLYLAALKASPGVDGFANLLTLYKDRRDATGLLRTLGKSIDSDQDTLESAEAKSILKDDKLIDEILEAARELNKKSDTELTYGMRVAAGLLAAEAKRFSAVDEFFKLALLSKPRDTQRVYQQWGLSFFLGEQYEQAVRVFQEAMDKRVAEPGDPTLHFHLSGALELSGRTEEALQVARDAVRVRGTPPLPILNERVAWILYHAKRYRDAITEYEKVIERFPGTSAAKTARLVLSNIYVLKKNMPKGEDYLLEVLDEYPDDAGASNDLGYLWADQNKNLERALRMIQVAVEHDPDNDAYQDSLGWALYRLGRFKEAIVPLEKAAAVESPDTVILDHVADCYLALGRTEDAVKSWTRAVEAHKTSRNPDPERLAQIQQKLKLHAAAKNAPKLKPAARDEKPKSSK